MREHLEAYLVWQRQQQRQRKTVVQYYQKVRSFLVWQEARPLTVETLAEYRYYRQREQRTAPATIRGDFSALWDFLAWLEAHGHAQGLPKAGSVKLPAVREQRAPCPTDDEVARLLAAADTMPTHTPRARYLRGRTRAIVHVLAFAGLRLSELLALQIGDIEQAESPWRIVVACGKGGEPGAVYYGAAGEQALTEWLAVRREWCREHRYVGEALWPVDRKRRLCERGMRTLWAELVSRAQIAWPLTPHCMRRWFGSRTQELEGIGAAKEQLRHSRLETTLRYMKTDVGKQKRSALRLKPILTAESGEQGLSPPGTAGTGQGARRPRMARTLRGRGRGGR